MSFTPPLPSSCLWTPSKLAELLERHALVAVQQLSGGLSARYVARVRTRQGATAILKAQGPQDGARETMALEAAAGCQAMVQVLDRLEPGVLLLEDLGEDSLASHPEDAPRSGQQAGAMIRTLHQELRRSPDDRHICDWEAIVLPEESDSTLRHIAQLALQYLRSMESAPLHGDLTIFNVVRAPRGMVALDPNGSVGPHGWDLAALAALCPAPGPTLRELVVGYGAVPPGLAASFWVWAARAERWAQRQHPVLGYAAQRAAILDTATVLRQLPREQRFCDATLLERL